jgi:hypothetical protein
MGAQDTEAVAPEPDLAMTRRVWLRLGLGTAGMLLLAAASWLFVTVSTIMALV